MTPDELSTLIQAALGELIDAGELTLPDGVPAVRVERPKVAEHGDYATNVAMQLAKPAGQQPRALAERIHTKLEDHPGIASVEVAGPGFLNITLRPGAQGTLATEIVTAGAAYGRGQTLSGQRLNLEFVSANPTGPLHIGAARWAAVGDALARILVACGAEVTREYYFNDAGAQIERFARSLYAAARDQPIPEDGYAGDYIHEIADAVMAKRPDVLDLAEPQALEVFRSDGVAAMFAEITSSLADFGVDFDVYFNEKDLHDKGELDAALTRLTEQGHVEERDGAIWLRTSDFGDDKDRVLRKSNGEWTYFTADCAYYLDKRERGADRVVMVLGADHHGYIGRMRAMAACFGDDPDTHLEILIGQMVNLVRAGEPLRMSKRAGSVVTMDSLVSAVGVDASRYALARYSTDTPIDVDLDLWEKQSSDNPVYYVQYAHARLAAIRRNAAELAVSADPATVDPSLLTHPREGDLLRSLAEFPKIVATAGELREPHRIARYLEDVAAAFHKFYDECRVLPRGDEEPTPLHSARLTLVDATRVVIANGLALLGVTAPERM